MSLQLNRRPNMVAVTYGAARADLPTSATAPAEGRKGRFARFMDALVEARLQAAEREIARHAHMLPGSFKFRQRRGELPFSGW
jgi:hypothetical protein